MTPTLPDQPARTAVPGEPVELPDVLAGAYVDIPFEVEPNYDGLRLDQYLTAKIKRLSRSRAQVIIEQHLVSERPLKCSSRVHRGLRFAIRRQRATEPETPDDVTVLYRDEWLVVVDKPAGLPVHPTARYHHGTLVHVLRRKLGEDWAEPVHRLDRETSGLVICARSPEVSRRFMRAFQRGAVHKQYLAVCEGHPPATFAVDAPLALGREIVRIGMRVDREVGRPARTRFETVACFEREGALFALVRAFPETGRQHQIRVHLQEAGFPIVGDKIYGADERLYDRFVEGRLSSEDHARLLLPRHALHAHRLELTHPGTGELVRFEAPFPADLAQFIAPVLVR
jgi:23S rRNA pseudouridine1911/1915/1917 synthase